MLGRIRFVLLFILSIVVVVHPSLAQNFIESRKRTLESELIVQTDAPTGATDILEFTSDGKYLFAAGDDKVVRMWPFRGAQGLDTLNMKNLRWSIYKQQRGAIYAAALSPNGKYMAVGGYGIRTGSVSVIRVEDGVVVNGYWGYKPGASSKNAPSYTVWSMDWSPSGKQLAFGDARGTIWLWDALNEKAVPKPIGYHPETVKRSKKTPSLSTHVKLVSFLSEKRLVSVAQDSVICEWDLGYRQPLRSQRQTGVNELFSASIDDNQRWLAVSGQQSRRANIVELHSLKGDQKKTVAIPQDGIARAPRCVRLNSNGTKLAIGFYGLPKKPKFRNVVQGGVLIYDVSGQPRLEKKIPCSWEPDRVAFSRDGRYVAVIGGNNYELNLWDVTRGNSERPIQTIASPGTTIWDVAVGTGSSHLLGFRDKRTPVPDHPNQMGSGIWRVFNLKALRWATPKEAQFFNKSHTTETTEYLGWKVEFLPPTTTLASKHQAGYDWYVTNTRRGRSYRIPLDRKKDAFPRCFTFFGGKNQEPVKIAVGHYWGYSIFALNDNSAPKLIRKGAGHQGEVMALAIDPKEQLLFTGSRDQTIACWRLTPHQYQSELGARFERSRDGRALTVTDVQPGSPAWEAGLQENDRINAFAYGTKLIFKNTDATLPSGLSKIRPKENRPGTDTFDALRAPTPQLQCYFMVQRAGERRQIAIQTTVRQRPLYRFFPMRDKEWVLWTYYDYFYATSTRGDSHIGWQLSGEVDVTPTFDKAEQYRNKFHREDRIRNLLKDVLAHRPQKASVLQIEAPQLKVVVAKNSVQNDDARIALGAVARGPQASSSKLSRINIWVNDFLYKTINADGSEYKQAAQIPNRYLRSGKNLIKVQAYNRAEVRREDTVEINCIRPQRKPNLYGLMVGMGKYDGPRAFLRGATFRSNGKKVTGFLPDLVADKDARGLAGFWEEQKGKAFAKVEIEPFLNDKVKRDEILQKKLIELKNKVTSDDFLLLYIGGHGVSDAQLKEDFSKIKGVTLEESLPPNTFLFCTSDINLRRPFETGITGDRLYKALYELPCHKIILLDTCHSGTITLDPVRELTPEGVGPIIFSACKPEQLAAESGLLSLQYAGGAVDGLFAIAMGEAMDHDFDAADKNNDKKVTPVELDQYLRQRVSDLRGLIDDSPQDPVAWIPEHEKQLSLFGK